MKSLLSAAARIASPDCALADDEFRLLMRLAEEGHCVSAAENIQAFILFSRRPLVHASGRGILKEEAETKHGFPGSAICPGASVFSFAASWLIGAALIAFALSLIFPSSTDITAFFLSRQDRWLLLVEAAVLTAGSIELRARDKPLIADLRLPLIVSGVLLLACFAGHYFVLSNYDMSRDEQMATFDAAVFAHGQLVQKLPAFWRDHADALNTIFMYPAEHRGAWISSYLPGNAAFRALIGGLTTPVLTGPLMTAIGALALWGCVRQIWPQDREAAVVALLLYAGSAQVIFTGMTAYAMPAHLALNLIWLWLFLRRALWADILALGVGFIATGLHQPLPHPLFAAPLLFLLLIEKQWSRVVIYALGYVAIGLFWLWWPNWMWGLVQAFNDTQKPMGVDYLTRLIEIVGLGQANGLRDMGANLLRFIAWQHLLLIPLLFLGLRIARRDRLAGALAVGIVLTIYAMTIIMPYQGHGFGYRYLHGLVGNCILLAVYGWKSLRDNHSKWRALLLRASAAGIVVVMPLQAWMAHAFYAPAAGISARINTRAADYAIIGPDDVPFAKDLVYNPPRLDRRPVRLRRDKIDWQLTKAICAKHAVIALVGDGTLEPIDAYYGFVHSTRADPADKALARVLTESGCRVSSIE